MRKKDIFGFIPHESTGFKSATGPCKCGNTACANMSTPQKCKDCCDGGSAYGTGKRDEGGFFIGASPSQPYMAASGGRMCPCEGCGHINIDADPFTGMGQLACARCCKGQQAGFRSASGVRRCIEHGFARCSGTGTYMQCRNRCTSKPSPKVGQFKGACGCGG